MKHITEASTLEMIQAAEGTINPQSTINALRAAFDFSPPQPAEGVAELIAELDEMASVTAATSDHGGDDKRAQLFARAAHALSQQSRPTPSDEELDAAYNGPNTIAGDGGHSHLLGLRAVAALTTPEGNTNDQAR